MSLIMTKAEREAFLGGVHVGILSIAREGAGPLTVPIWYDYTPGGDAWIITGASSLKGRALARVTRVSLCAQNEKPPYCYVSIEGPFTTRAATKDELLHMAVRYLGEQQGKQYAEAAGSSDDSLVISIKPENWLTTDYGKSGQ